MVNTKIFLESWAEVLPPNSLLRSPECEHLRDPLTLIGHRPNLDLVHLALDQVLQGQCTRRSSLLPG